MFLSYLTGLGASLGLIVAIGAQNAFVLRQGIKREWVLPVVLVCTLSDAALIFSGVAGIGAVVQGAPALLQVIRWIGVAFLVTYGFFAAKRALRPGTLHAASGRGNGTLWATIATTLALTWLNPTCTSTPSCCSARSRTPRATAAGPSASAPRPQARCGSHSSGTGRGR